jgi:hypothetical protein
MLCKNAAFQNFYLTVDHLHALPFTKFASLTSVMKDKLPINNIQLLGDCDNFYFTIEFEN